MRFGASLSALDFLHSSLLLLLRSLAHPDVVLFALDLLNLGSLLSTRGEVKGF